MVYLSPAPPFGFGCFGGVLSDAIVRPTIDYLAIATSGRENTPSSFDNQEVDIV